MVDRKPQDRELVQFNLGHYEVLGELGEGGVGEVYVARPTRGEHAGTLVCLKVMRRAFQAARDSRRKAAIDSLRREASVVSQLEHANIAKLLDSGAYNDVWFLVFELVEGANLGEILELQPAGLGLEPEHVRRIGIEVAAALQCAHEHDVLHRDIKPQNVLISTNGQVKVVDFGVAKVNAREAADFTVGVGTPRYWAPEQIREDVVSPQTDIFALGLVLYELLTTAHPFHHDDHHEHRKNVLRGTLSPHLREADFPGDLVSIVERCLEHDPAKRFESAQALQAALRSGAKASGFEYEMGEIATAARDAVVEERLLMKDDVIGERGNDNKTAVPDMHLRETRHASPGEVANAVKDSIPGALTRHVRDEVVRDLSLLAQHAYEQRQTDTGRRPEATAREGWQHPGISGVRPSKASTAPQIRVPPNAEHGSSGSRVDADTPLVTRMASYNSSVAKDTNATNVVPRERAARWPLAIAAVALTALCAVLMMSPGTRGREGQPQPTLSASANRVTTSVDNSQTAPSQQPVAHQLPTAVTAERVDETESAPERSSPSPAKATATGRPHKLPRTEARELVEVTIGVIPFGNVTVDGKPVGPAPVVVKLAPGSHRIVGRSLQLSRVQTAVVTPTTNQIVLDLRNHEAAP